MKMTREIARAISVDEANRNMRRNGRKAWNEDDSEVYVATYDRLWPIEKDIEEARMAARERESLQNEVDPLLDASWIGTGDVI